MKKALKKKLLSHLFTEQKKSDDNVKSDTKVYAILDASQDEMIASTIQGLASNVRLLMHGSDLEEYGDDAPWLVEIKEDEFLLKWMLKEGWGKRWFVLIKSQSSINVLLESLNKFITVVDDEGEEVYFRFYDPFVLATHLPVFSKEQRELFFKNVQDVSVEIGSKAYMSMSFQQDVIDKTIVELTEEKELLEESGVFSLPKIDTKHTQAEPIVIFSKEQLEFPILSNRPLLIDHLDEHLRESFETRMNCYPKGSLNAMIDRGIELSFEYKIFDLTYIRLFSHLMWEIAPGFYKEPSIHEVISYAKRTPEEKFDYLMEDKFETPWMNAMDYDDPKEWFDKDSQEFLV